MKSMCLLIVGLLLLFSTEAALADKPLTFTVKAGDHAIAAVPLSVKLPAEFQNLKSQIILVPEGGGDALATQVEQPPSRLKPHSSSLLWFIPKKEIAAGTKRIYRLQVLKDGDKRPPVFPTGRVEIEETGKQLIAKVGGKPVLHYNNKVVREKEGETSVYDRSGYIHPVVSPGGVTLTGDFAEDHKHQHGIWFAWTKTQFKGHKVDFWNQAGKLGDVEHAGIVSFTSGPIYGELVVKQRHIDETGKVPEIALDETWRVRVFNLSDEFVFDLHSEQTCATDQPLHLLKHHYGGMAYRAPYGWGEPNGGFLTSDGKNGADGNHTTPRWVDAFGLKDGKTIGGVTVLQHPDNFRFPSPARLHRKFTYFCYAPMVQGDFQIEPGKPYVSRYRYIAHDGAVDVERTEALWRNYANPPRLAVAGSARGDLNIRKPTSHDEGKDLVSYEIAIRKDGSVVIDGEIALKEEAGAATEKWLEKIQATTPPERINLVIKPHADVPYADVIRLIGTVKEATPKLAKVTFAPPEAPSKSIEIVVEKNGSALIDGAVVEARGRAAAIRAKADKLKDEFVLADIVVVLRADSETPTGTVQDAVQECQAAGFETFVLRAKK